MVSCIAGAMPAGLYGLWRDPPPAVGDAHGKPSASAASHVAGLSGKVHVAVRAALGVACGRQPSCMGHRGTGCCMQLPAFMHGAGITGGTGACLQELATAAMCTKHLTTDRQYGQPFVLMLEVLATEALQRMQGPAEQAAVKCLNGNEIAEILSAFSHFRYHPGDAFLQAALTTLRIQLQDMRQQVSARPALIRTRPCSWLLGQHCRLHVR